MITKAVILARGLGKRMRAESESTRLNEKQSVIASQGIKALVPILGDKTLLDFSLERLEQAGFTEICLVIGDEHQAIRDYCNKLKYNISFAIQEKPLGTANAVLAAEGFVKDDLFLMVNSDNLYPWKDLQKLRNLNSPGLIAYNKKSLIEKSNIDEEKINKFAVMSFDDGDFLTEVVEKPEKVEKNAFISMSAFVFSPKIFEACKKIKLSKRGEYELADALNYSILNFGEKFKAVYSNEGVLDLSSRTDIEKVREKLIENG